MKESKQEFAKFIGHLVLIAARDGVSFNQNDRDSTLPWVIKLMDDANQARLDSIKSGMRLVASVYGLTDLDDAIAILEKEEIPTA